MSLCEKIPQIIDIINSSQISSLHCVTLPEDILKGQSLVTQFT